MRNPFNANRVSRVSLSPSVVDCVVFWTKNPGPILGKRDVLDNVPCSFLYMLTAYGLDVEPRLRAIAAEHGMELAACAQRSDFSQVGVSRSARIDRLLVERLIGSPIKVGKDKSQRPECLCAESVDIGRCDTCGHGCCYCYANHSDSVLRRNLAHYDPVSPLLCDSPREDDVITERSMHSLVADSFDAGQLSFGPLL